MVKARSYHHPLDALTAEEIQACSRACATYAEDKGLDNLRFNVISLKVPPQNSNHNLRLATYLRRSCLCYLQWGCSKPRDDLQEPTKLELLAYEADKAAVPARTAYCIVQAFPKSPVNEVYLDLSGAKASVISWKQVRDNTLLCHCRCVSDAA